MKLKDEYKKRWEDWDKKISKLSVDIYGIDTSKMSWKEEQTVREMMKQRLELQAIYERKKPQPVKQLTKGEEMTKKKLLLRLAQIQHELKSMDAQAELYEQRGR